MDPYEKRMAEGWQALTLQTTDVIVRVEDTGQLVNMSALKTPSRPGVQIQPRREAVRRRPGALLPVRGLHRQTAQGAGGGGTTWRPRRQNQQNLPQEQNPAGQRRNGRKGGTPEGRGRTAPGVTQKRPRKNTPAGLCRIKDRGG